MFATIAAMYLGYLALMWRDDSIYNVTMKVLSFALAVWALIVALKFWGLVVPAIS